MRFTGFLLCLVAVTATPLFGETEQQLTLQGEVPPAQKPALTWSDALQVSALPTDAESAHTGKSSLASLAEEFQRAEPQSWARHPSSKTIYEWIQATGHTRRFAALVDKFPDIVELLNSTSGSNITAFVPLDDAFDRVAEFNVPHHKPSKEFVKALVEYHILPKNYSLIHLNLHNTLPTILKPETLGGRPQRIRISGLGFLLRINGRVKVIVGDMPAKNGVIQGVDHILVPPPPAKNIISAFPTLFSTFELAARKTGLFPPHDHHHHDKKPGDGDGDDDGHRHHHHYNATGLTLFAPTNYAFKRLGPRANAFLFNTKKGLCYLRALMKYHVVVNETLYTDEYYGVQKEKGAAANNSGGDSETEAAGYEEEGIFDNYEADHLDRHFHIDMPTLLDGKSVAVDIHRFHAFISMRVNSRVTVDHRSRDIVVHDGVVQPINALLIPPHSKPGIWRDEEDGDGIAVDEIVERLRPYVDENELVGVGEEKERPDDKDRFEEGGSPHPVPSILDAVKSIFDLGGDLK